MRLKLILLIAAIFYCLLSFGQNTVTDSSATCVAYWHKGDTKEIQITRTTRLLSGGKQQNSSSNAYGATIRILEASDSGYTIQWKYKVPGPVTKNSPGGILNSLLANLTIIYCTDETGMFDSLINYDELKIFFEKTISLLGEQSKDKDEFKKTEAMMKSMFASKDNLTALLLREIILYHSPFGIEYFSNHDQEEETLLPNAFGGEPFPATLQLTLLKMDPTIDFAQILVEQQIDKVKAADIIQEILKKLATDAEQKPINKDKMGLREVAINDRTLYDLQLSTGWIKKVLFKREVILGDSRKIEVTELKMK